MAYFEPEILESKYGVCAAIPEILAAAPSRADFVLLFMGIRTMGGSAMSWVHRLLAFSSASRYLF
jgi:hypothetical protein